MSEGLPPRDWPNRDASRRVRADGFNWHVQVMGAGPALLLLHGTGAATHSWRELGPALAQHFTVVAPDLPGHGWTEAPASRRFSLPGMARSLQSLLWAMEVRPAMAAGHSAGAAVAVRMALDGTIDPRALVGLNAAMLPLGGIPGEMFSPLAKVLAGLPLLPNLFAWRARDRRVVEKLLVATGSRIGSDGAAQYARLLREPRHAAAALGMMAHWDLKPLLAELPRLHIPLLLIVGGNDRTVPPAQSASVRDIVPGATLETLPGLGHLAHEEQPARVDALMTAFARRTGVLP